MNGHARIVSDPAQVREVLRRVDDFRPDNALVSVVPLEPATLRKLARARFALPPVLASAHGPRHLLVRRALAGFFSPATVQALRPMLEELADDVATAAASALRAGQRVDLAHAVAEAVPPRALATLLGVELPDEALLHRWSRDSLELFWGWPTPARQLELADSASELFTWLRAAAARDIASHSPHGGRTFFRDMHDAGLSMAELCSLAYFLIIAGQETTTQLIGICLLRGLETPARREALTAGGEHAARDHVRTVLATESSVPTWRRIAHEATTLGGDAIPAGAEIVLELTGHHGPNPAPNAHALAFGHGLHRCLGAGLAELQATLVTAATFRALPPETTLAEQSPPWRRLLSFQTPARVEAVLT